MFNINLVNTNLGRDISPFRGGGSANYNLDQAGAYVSEIDELSLLYHVQTLKAGLTPMLDEPKLAERYFEKKKIRLS